MYLVTKRTELPKSGNALFPEEHPIQFHRSQIQKMCVYKERHLLECFFNKIKYFHRVATRYDKLASSFLAFAYVGAIFILSK